MSIILDLLFSTSSKRNLYQNDSFSRIFHSGGEGVKKPEILGVVNDEGESGREEESITERHDVLTRYRQYRGTTWCVRTLSLGGMGCVKASQDVSASEGYE